jgi:hypothetical protein
MSKITEMVKPSMVTSSRIFCCFCHTVIVIGSCPVVVIVRSNLIELTLFASPSRLAIGLVVPVGVVVVTDVVDDDGVVDDAVVVDVLVEEVDVVFVVVVLVDVDDWVVPPPHAVNINESETNRATKSNNNLVFTR